MDDLTYFHQAGDTANIYHDPLTEKALEGPARLVKRLAEDRAEGRPLALWRVRFLPGEGTYERWIRVHRPI